MVTNSAAGFSDVFYSAEDGLKLHARIYGTAAEGALPVICLPGLTRNARDFHALALILSGDPSQPRQVIAFDYRGWGDSDSRVILTVPAPAQKLDNRFSTEVKEVCEVVIHSIRPRISST